MNRISPHQLRKEFLEFLHVWHADRAYLPFPEIAYAEGIEVDDAREVQDQYIHNKMRILINRNQSIRRKRFTGMHEVGHYIFKTAQNGRFTKLLESLFPGDSDTQRDAEEDLVNLGGFQLLIPRPVFREICTSYEYDSKRAQIMAIKTRCSLAAAGQRIALAVDRPVGGIILNAYGDVLDFFGNDVKRYLTAGRGHKIDRSHPICQKPFSHDEVEFFHATIPYKRSPKKVPRYMQALCDEMRGQTIVFFNAPRVSMRGQQRLFPEHS